MIPTVQIALLETAFLIGLAILGLILLILFLKRRWQTRVRISGPPFTQRPLLNTGEVRLLKALERAAPVVLGSSARVCPQVSYGEFLTCASFGKFVRINSKRADFVVITGAAHVALVVELQGSGHFGSTSKSAARARRSDRLKRAVLNEAGIPLLEVRGKISGHDLTAKIREQTAVQQGGTPQCTQIIRSRPEGAAHD